MNRIEVKRRQIQAFSYMLGLVNLIVFGKMLGDSGVAYLAAAVEVVALVVIITAAGIPDVLGRMIKGLIAKGQYKNANKLCRSVLLLQLLLGIIGGAALFLTADVLAEKVLRIPYSTLAMRIMTPVILLRVINGVLLGKFQGNGSQTPSAVSGILRQIFMLGLGLLAVKILGGYGEKVSSLLRSQVFTPMYGAAGIALAVVLSELLLLLFLLVMNLGSKRKREKPQDAPKRAEGGIGAFYKAIGSVILLYLLSKLPVLLGMIWYPGSVADVQAAAGDYGIYYGKYLAVCAFPILLYGAGMLPTCAKTTFALRKGEPKRAKDIFQSAVHLGLARGLFVSVFLAIMAEQVSVALFGNGSQKAAQLLQGGSFVILFGILTGFFLQLLQWNGKMLLTLAGMGIYATVASVVMLLGLFVGKGGIAMLVYALVAGLAVVCILTGWLLWRQLEARLDIISMIAVPAVAAGVTGLLCMLLGKLFTPHLGELVAVIVCLVVSGAVYWGGLLLLRNFRRQELEQAGGKFLIWLGELFRCF